MQALRIVFVCFVFFSIPSYAQVTSTFNTDAEGWILRNDGKNITATITHHTTGGNPGGRISGEVGVDNYPAFFWQAPAKFRGNLAYRSFGQTLTFSLQQALVGDNGEYNGNYVESQSADIIISNGSQSIYFHTSPKPNLAPNWSTYSVTLSTASAWRTSASITSGLATNAQIKTVLNNVTSLHIRANYNLTANTLGLSNVSLGQRSIFDPPVVSGISATSAHPGSSITISGNNFAPDPADNFVFFGSIRASVTSANTTQLVVTVPAGAPYDYIKVLNKVTGLTTSSTKPFIPTFPDGGRIIAASFKPKIELPISVNGPTGLNMADLDGDGWNDIAVSETSVTLSLFRNRGNGGTLAPTSFDNKITLTGAGNDRATHIADLDNDGKPDIISVVNDGFQTSFATFRNTSTPGTLSFEPAELWPGLVYSGITSEVIDVDGDGLIDLIGQHQNGSAAPDFWITQNISTPGNIEFSASVSYFGSVLVDAGAGVTAGDLNGDGKPDMLIKYGFGNAFALAENTSVPGTISFGSPIAFSRSSYGKIVIGDFNLDGKNDIALKHGFFNDDIIMYINTDSDGVLTAADFSTQLIFETDLFAGGTLNVADINGDGKVDILATDGTYFGVFENAYSGGVFNANSFTPAYLVGTEGFNPVDLPPGVADLNGDGRPEVVLVINNTNPKTLAIFENQNVHSPFISLNTISPLSGPIGSSVTITGNNFSVVPSENSVMFGAVRGTVTEASETSLTVTVPAGASLARISVTRDRLTSTYHLPFTPTFSGGVSFDDTHFAPPVSFSVSSVQYDPEVADLNNDGKPDIIVNGSGNGLTFRNTHTSGSISSTSLTAGATANSASPPRLMDLDGDGKIDLVGGSNVFRNISSGDPIDYSTSVYISPGGFFFNDFADFNRDGRMDFIGVNGSVIALIENRTTVGAFLGLTRASSFSNSIQFSKPAVGGSVVTSDFDNDGETDIAATNPGTDNVSVWRNNGAYRITTTQFTALPTIAVGDNPSRIYTGDFDWDGKIDLLIIHSTGTTTTQITLLQNQSTPGNISFSAPINIINPSALTVAHIADLDGDGKPEIITTSESGNRLSIFKNIHTSGALSAGSFAAPFNTTVTAPRGLTTCDLNLDGKPEIILTRAAGFLMVYENLIPVISISLTSQPTNSSACEGGSATFSTAASGTTNITYQWQFASSLTGVYADIANTGGYSGADTNTLSVNTTGNFGAGFYRCQVKGDGASTVFSSVAQLTINAIPATPTINDGFSCGPGNVLLSASGGTNGQYRWYTLASGGSAITGEVNATYSTPSLTTSTNYYVSINNGTCESIRVEVKATILTIPTAPVVTSSSNCGPGSVLLQASGATDGQYRWYDVATGGTAIAGEVNSTFTTPALTISTTYYVSINTGSCESARTEAIATILPIPAKPTITANQPINAGVVEICLQTVILSAPTGFTSYAWNNSQITQQINAIQPGNYSVSVTDASGCSSTPSDPIQVINATNCVNNPPVINTTSATTFIGGKIIIDLSDLISDPDDNLDVASLQVIGNATQKGGKTSLNGFILEIDYATAKFSGKDLVTIRVCDLLNVCFEANLEIEVIGDIVVYNGISPNGDGKNDTWEIEYITLFPDTQNNRVTIYNRWGDIVWEVSNYDNDNVVFTGLNKNGSELSTGTYFYKIEFESGRETITGYLSLKR
jgi:gliding motility-associated-like protein